MSRPSQARGRRGLKQEAEQLARRGRPPKPPAPAAPATAPPATAGAVAGAGPPSENQGKQFGLTVRALVAPLYVAVVGFELPPQAWEEWGVAGGRFAAYYFPNAAVHPGYQFAAASAMMLAPVLLAWPVYTAKRAAARKAAADAAKRAKDGDATAPAPRPAATGIQVPPDASRPAAPPALPARPGHSIGGGWGGARRDKLD